MNQFQDQNCDGYTRTALMGNWYEDREAINQPFNTDRDFRQVQAFCKLILEKIRGSGMHCLSHNQWTVKELTKSLKSSSLVN